jgi:ElaA protein
VIAMTATVHFATIDEIQPRRLYEILRLRVEVFVVEQQCAYADLDGRDTEPGARLLWAEIDGNVVATLRLLDDDDRERQDLDNDGTRRARSRIGRVATARSARGAGVAKLLMGQALELCAGREVVLDAQSHLRGWYEQFGFIVDADEFVEDGIAHLPMRRAPGLPHDTSDSLRGVHPA